MAKKSSKARSRGNRENKELRIRNKGEKKRRRNEE
jgi:hypothetical protein